MSYLKRLRHELAELETAKEAGSYVVLPDKDDLLSLDVIICGPIGSPYEGGTFHVFFKLPPEYPFKPPHVVFRTPCFHPGIDQKSGDVCQEIFARKWNPRLRIRSVIDTLVNMLDQYDSIPAPVDTAIADLIERSRPQFLERCREMVNKHAKDVVY